VLEHANAPLLEFVRTGGEVSVVDLPGAAPLAARQALSQ
jgi:hypothetical protein